MHLQQKVNEMAGTKKIPERMCIGCQTVHPKKEMIRIVRSPEGKFSVDTTGKKSGRGAYICQKETCFQTAVKEHRFEKSFKSAMNPEVYEELKQQLFPSKDA